MDVRRYYKLKALRPGQFKEAFLRSVGDLAQQRPVSVTHRRSPGDGVDEDFDLDIESVHEVTDLGDVDFTLRVHDKETSFNSFIRISCKGHHGALLVLAQGTESVQCLERLVVNLGLERTQQPRGPIFTALDDLAERLCQLEESTFGSKRRLRCFVSFKFGNVSADTVVTRLKRFLEAADVETLTGEQYEPRRIEDKVQARLRADVDFVIAVITSAGESSWIRDELGDARARGLPVIVLLESAAKFDKGIFGTLEYIPYQASIDESFLSLLEGINFIRAERVAEGSPS